MNDVNIIITENIENINIIVNEETNSIALNIDESNEQVSITVSENIASEGLASDYGFAFYQHSIPQKFSAGVRKKLLINPSFEINQLRTPFNNHNFIQDEKLIARQVNDYVSLAVRFFVTSEIIDTVFRLELDIGGEFNSIEKPVIKTNVGAGEEDVITEFFVVFTGSTFIENGGEFFITSNSNLEITKMDIRLSPMSASL